MKIKVGAQEQTKTTDKVSVTEEGRELLKLKEIQ